MAFGLFVLPVYFMWEKAIGERSPQPAAWQLLAASHTYDIACDLVLASSSGKICAASWTQHRSDVPTAGWHLLQVHIPSHTGFACHQGFLLSLSSGSLRCWCPSSPCSTGEMVCEHQPASPSAAVCTHWRIQLVFIAGWHLSALHNPAATVKASHQEQA